SGAEIGGPESCACGSWRPNSKSDYRTGEGQSGSSAGQGEETSGRARQAQRPHCGAAVRFAGSRRLPIRGGFTAGGRYDLLGTRGDAFPTRGTAGSEVNPTRKRTGAAVR